MGPKMAVRDPLTLFERHVDKSLWAPRNLMRGPGPGGRILRGGSPDCRHRSKALTSSRTVRVFAYLAAAR